MGNTRIMAALGRRRRPSARWAAFVAIGVALALQMVPPFGSAWGATLASAPTAAVQAATPVTGVDLQVTMSGPATALPGSTIADSLLIANDGTDPATGVAFELSPPPPGATYVIDPAVATCDTSTWDCTLAADLLPSSQVSIALQVQTAPPLAAGSVVNPIAHATTSATDVDPSNDTDGVSTTLSNAGQLAVTLKRSGTGAILPGQRMGYHVTLTNTGPNVAQAPKLYLYPPESPYSTDTTASSPGATCKKYLSAGAWVCSWPSLAAGASRDVTFLDTASTHLLKGSSFYLIARAVATNSVETAGVTSVPVTDTTTRAVDMSVKTSMTPKLKPGKKGTWKITVANLGKYRAHDVVLTSTLPDGFTWVGFDGKPGKGDARTKSVKLGDIEPGTTLTQSGKFSYPAGITLVLHLSVTQADPDARKSNNESESTSRITGPVVSTKSTDSTTSTVSTKSTTSSSSSTSSSASDTNSDAVYDDAGQLVSGGTTSTGDKKVLADTGGPALQLPLMGFTLVLLGAVSSASSRRRRPAPRHRAWISPYA